MYNVLTSLSTANEENVKSVFRVKILKTKNEQLDLVEVKCHDLMQRNAYLKNKIKCMTEVEAYLRKEIEEIEFKFKPYQTLAFKAREVIDKQTIHNTTTICYDYGRKKNKNKVKVTKQISNITKDVPHILRNINAPIYKMSSTEPLDTVEILIKYEILLEDLAIDNSELEEDEEELKVEEPKEEEKPKVHSYQI